METTARNVVRLIKRERKIDPVTLPWVLVLGFGVGLQRTLASLRRAYETASAKKLAPSAFYDRFTPHAANSLGFELAFSVKARAVDSESVRSAL